MVERKRHLAKAITYRLLGSTATAAIAYWATGDARIGAGVGVLDSVLKIGLYYIHERVWYRVRWGVHADPHAARRPEVVITTDGRRLLDRAPENEASAPVRA